MTKIAGKQNAAERIDYLSQYLRVGHRYVVVLFVAQRGAVGGVR